MRFDNAPGCGPAPDDFDTGPGACAAPDVSIVVIGLDEGPRLPRALESARAAVAALGGDAEVIYVDSGSRDGSVERARATPGVRVAAIARAGASAARARNLGISLARGALVQLLDGDMELDPAWLPAARGALAEPSVAAAAGRLFERGASRSIWNRAFGLDWRRSAGPAETVGGAALWRRDVLVALGGFDEGLRVGEDPDLAHRARARGHALFVLDRPMATHDLDLRGARDYWRRALAVGASRANVAWRHPRSGARRALAHAFAGVAAVGVAACAAALAPAPTAALALAAAAAVLLRRAALDRAGGASAGDALVHALHVYAVKLPVSLGAARQLARLASGRRA